MSPFLKIGTTCAHVQSVGNFAEAIKKLINLVKEYTIDLPASLSTRGLIKSGPKSLLVFKFCKISRTSCSVTVIQLGGYNYENYLSFAEGGLW